MGGEAKLSDKGWGVGCRVIYLNKTKAWMEPPLDTYKIFYSHRDQVKTLPPEAELLGSNDHCTFGMYMMGDHILSMQGHTR